MKKNFKKSKLVILPALATLILTGVASVTGTVAWFAASRNVDVTGMHLKAQSSSNLLIAASTTDATTKVADDHFKSSLTWDNTNPATLTPASTIDGKNYFLSNVDIKGNGSIETPAEGTNKYKAVGSETAFIDFTVQMKAVNVKTEDCKIYVDQLDLKYNGGWAGSDGVKAFRVAFFTEKCVEETFTNGPATSSTAVIYEPAKTANFEPNHAVKDVSSLDTVNYVSAATSLATVTKSSTEYFKTIIRVWLEGEDVNCTSDLFKNYSEDWSLDLGFTLGEKTTETGSILNIQTSNPQA